MSKVCIPALLNGLRYSSTSMKAREPLNQAADEKTCGLVCSSKVSLLLVVRSLIESSEELLSFCNAQSTYKCARHSLLTHTKLMRYNTLPYLYLTFEVLI